MLDFVAAVLLGIFFYSSGFLLWPLRCWLHRKKKMRGCALMFVFLAQFSALIVFIFANAFYRGLLDVGYGWGLLWIELNILFTVIGAGAWIRDALYERNLESN